MSDYSLHTDLVGNSRLRSILALDETMLMLAEQIHVSRQTRKLLYEIRDIITMANITLAEDQFNELVAKAAASESAITDCANRVNKVVGELEDAHKAAINPTVTDISDTLSKLDSAASVSGQLATAVESAAAPYIAPAAAPADASAAPAAAPDATPAGDNESAAPAEAPAATAPEPFSV